MTIDLPEDLERSINAQDSSGHFSTVGDAIAEAWRAFLQQCTPETVNARIALEDVHRKMLADGLISQLPNTHAQPDDDCPSMEIEGEPFSETIIRERR